MASTKAQEETAEASQLVARELASAINTPKLLEDHLKVTNGFTRTRFPPEVSVIELCRHLLVKYRYLPFLPDIYLRFETAKWLLACGTCQIDEHELRGTLCCCN